MNILDTLDFFTNFILMPVVALITCIFVGKGIGSDVLIREVKHSSPFRRERLFSVRIRWGAPICIFAILISLFLSTLGILNL